MERHEIEALLTQLENGEIDHLFVAKEQFLAVREVVVAHPKFKHFRGVAEQGGNVTYYYVTEARS